MTTNLAPTAATATHRDVSALFEPRAVAVIGASNDESKYGNWISAQALHMRAQRPVYLINQRGVPVLGEATYRTIADVPTPVDLVVIAVPAASFEQAVYDALTVGARAIVAITAGFGELGEQGQRRQDEVVAQVRAAGAVLLGPNCLGVFDATSGLQLTSNPLPGGSIGLISQSGNMALELSRLLAASGLGFSRFASLGNQADVGVAELVRAYTAHEDTKLIALYCEDFGDGREFCAAAAEAAAAGKPVVLLTVGGSAAAARGAASHTGAMTSASAVIDATCLAAGVDRVDGPAEMVDLLMMLQTYGPAPAERVAVLADGGGHAAVACDLAETQGLTVPAWNSELAENLQTELPPSAGVDNPVDVAGAGEQDITSFTRLLQQLLSSTETDAVLVTGYFGGYGAYGETLGNAEVETAQAMAAQVHAYRKPVVLHTMYPDTPAATELRRGGVPVFSTVEQATRALGRHARHASHPSPTLQPIPLPRPPVTGSDYWAARELLRSAGVPFPDARLASNAGEVAPAAEQLGYPVVVKALGLVHKSDAGGVALDLADGNAAQHAATDMQSRLNPPGYCVEAMAETTHAVELIAGVQHDPRFGPIVMVGLGGVFTEVLGDIAFALAPLDRATAKDLLNRLRGATLLHGTRGRPPVALDSLADTIIALTEFAASQPDLADIEINPLIATPTGTIALDARITRAEP